MAIFLFLEIAFNDYAGHVNLVLWYIMVNLYGQNRKMKTLTGCLLLVLLWGLMFSSSFSQQNQSTQKPPSELEALKKRLSELEGKLQTVENIEKMELAAKLADANAKLRNAETDKYKRVLKDANNEWLRTWSLWFVGIIGFLVLIVGGAFWFWLRSRTDELIAGSVEKSLNGFKEGVAQVDILKNQLEEAVGQVNILRNQIRILEKEHAASVIAGSVHLYDSQGESYSETIKALSDNALLDLFNDKTSNLDYKYKAAEILATRNSPRLVSPLLEYLNSIVDSNDDWDDGFIPEHRLRWLVRLLEQIQTQETYDGLKKFFNRLLTENPKYEFVFLTFTVFTLADISVKLQIEELVPVLKNTIPELDPQQLDSEGLIRLAVYFNRFNDPEGIMEMLRANLPLGLPDVEQKCLELLVDYYPEFVEERMRETSGTQNEEPS